MNYFVSKPVGHEILYQSVWKALQTAPARGTSP